jgi:hypothetical protein
MANQQKYHAGFRNSRPQLNSLGGTIAQDSIDFMPASLTNFELSAMHAGYDPLSPASVRDFTLKNVTDVRNVAVSKVKKSKQQIEMIHG